MTFPPLYAVIVLATLIFLILALSLVFSIVDSPISVAPTHDQFAALQERYSFQPEDGVTFLGEYASFINLLEGKIDIYVKHFDARYHLPMSYFFREVLRTHKFHINQLVPNGINKVVAFEMLFRANGISPDI